MVTYQVLIISEVPINSQNGFGKLLSTLFANWPSEKIRTFYTDNQYKEIEGFSDFAHIPQSPGRRYSFPFLLGMKPEWRGRFSKKWLKKKLNGYQPDFVYSLIHSESTAVFGSWIAEQLNKPHILHIADMPFSGKCNELLKSAILRSDRLVSISQPMADYFKNNINKESDVIFHGCTIDQKNSTTKWNNNSTFTVRYIGSLLESQHSEAIEDIADAVSKLNIQGFDIKLEIYGTQSPEKWSERFCKAPIIQYFGQFDEKEYVKLIKTSSLLIIPFTFNKQQQQSYKYSFPAKLPDYLASGIPLLLYGPSDIAAIQFTSENNLAISQSERSITMIMECLVGIINDYDTNVQKALQDQEIAVNSLSSSAMQQAFLSILDKTVLVKPR
jgi:glycosyltransferase involved in cell wall biosynthesis